MKVPVPNEASLSALIDAHLEEYTQRTGVTRQRIAERIHRSPAWLSRLARGKQGPSPSAELLRQLASELGLDPAEEERLISASRRSESRRVPVVTQPTQVRRTLSTLREVREPELGYLSSALSDDHEELDRAWWAFGSMRRDLYERNWDRVSLDSHGALESAARLRQIADRYESWVLSLRAAAMQHRNQLDAAEEATRNALQLANSAGDEALQISLQTRLGDLHRTRSEFDQARTCYDQAIGIATRLRHDFPKSDPLSTFVEHWLQALGRKLGTLHLFRGEPLVALGYLGNDADSLPTSKYESARWEFARGWALNLLGRRNAGRDAHRRGRDLAVATKDPRGAFQGALYVGSDELDFGDLAAANAHMNEARSILDRHSSLTWYHETGRLYLQEGLLALEQGDHAGSFQSLTRARLFYETAKDPVRGASVNIAIGRSWQRLGDWASAQASFEAARELAGKASPAHPYYLASATISLAESVLRSTRGAAVVTAREYLMEADQLANRHGYPRQRADVAAIRALASALTDEPVECFWQHVTLALLPGQELRSRFCDETWVLESTQKRLRSIAEFLPNSIAADLEARLSNA